MDPAPKHGHGRALYQLRARAAQLRIKVMNARIVDNAGIETQKILHMVNTSSPERAANCRASKCPIDKSLKLQAPSSKLQAASSKRATICRIDTRCSCDVMSH